MPERTAGTVLAFDYGIGRIGVAVGEEATGLAHPLGGIDARGKARFAAIARLVAEWRPALVLVGRPLSPEGAAHELTRRAERFARQLAGRFALPVALVDERWTTAEAHARLAGRRAPRLAADAVAAQLLIEQYFGERAAA